MWIDDLYDLSKRLPTGATDPKAFDKYKVEIEEFAEAGGRGDRIGAILEAADCLYYLAKSVYNNLISQTKAWSEAQALSDYTGYPLDVLVEAAKIKYALRAAPGSPKRDRVERAAVGQFVKSIIKLSLK